MKAWRAGCSFPNQKRQERREGGRKGRSKQKQTKRENSPKLKQFTCVARELLALTQKSDWLYLRHPICQVPNQHIRGQDNQSLTSAQNSGFHRVVPRTATCVEHLLRLHLRPPQSHVWNSRRGVDQTL